MRKALHNNKRPYISIKNLNMPKNRINQNGLLDHPSELIEAYKKKHKRKHPHQGPCSLLKIFKKTQPFNLANSTLPASFVEKLLSKKVAAWASQQLKFHTETVPNNSYNNSYYNSFPNFGAYSSSKPGHQGYPYHQNHQQVNTSYAKSSLRRLPGQLRHGSSLPQFSSGYRQSHPQQGFSPQQPPQLPLAQQYVSKGSRKVDLKAQLSRMPPARSFRNQGFEPQFSEDSKSETMISLRKRVNSSSRVEIDLQNLSDDESCLLVRRKRLKVAQPAKEKRSKSASRFDKRKFAGIFNRGRDATTAFKAKNEGFSIVKSSSFSGASAFKRRSSFIKNQEIDHCDVSKLKNLSIPKISKSSNIMKNTRDILNSNFEKNQNLKIFMSR